MQFSEQSKAAFALVGAMRSGTTSAFHCLSQHPLIKLCAPGQTGFFANDELFTTGSPDPSLYDNLYPGAVPGIIKGEVCPEYLYHSSSISRLSQYNKDIKLISILRNPAERAYSHWQMAADQGLENRPFIEAIKDEMRSSSNSKKDQSAPITSYISRGMYGWQIRTLYHYFDPHQLLFLRADDFKYDTEVILYQIFQFLSVPYLEVDCTAQNVGDYYHSLKVEDYNSVIKIFEKDIYLTEELLGWNLNEWIRPANTKRPMEAYFQ